jgi:hypothetical protein
MRSTLAQYTLGVSINLTLVTTIALAQQQPGGGMGMGGVPQPGPAPQPSPQTAAVEERILPEVKINDMTLDAVMEFLRDVVPGFNSSIVRAPGVPKDYPKVQFTLKDVSLAQLFELIKTSYPGIEIARIEGPKGPLYVIKIMSGPDMASAGPPGMVAGGFGVGIPRFGDFAMAPGAAQGQPDSSVHVYRLTDIITSLARAKPRPSEKAEDKAGVTKEAMSDVLALVQAALDQTDEETPSSIKVHEGTQALVFKGGRRKQQVLEGILAAFQPKHDDAQQKRVAELQRQLEVAEERLAMMRDRQEEATELLRKELDAARNRLVEQQHALEQSKLENALLRADVARMNESLKAAGTQATKPKE